MRGLMIQDAALQMDLEFKEDSKILYVSPKRKAARAKAIAKGFEDEYHMDGFNYFNRLSNEQYNGFEVDFLHVHTSMSTFGSSD